MAMTFPNAFAGIEKIHLALILALMGKAAIVAGEAFSRIATGSIMGLAAVIGYMLICIAFIIELTGLYTASKDEPLFKRAFIFAIAGAAAPVLAIAASGWLVSLSQTVSSVASFLVTFYVIKGIIALAHRIGDPAVVQKGEGRIVIIVAARACSLLASSLGQHIPAGTAAIVFEIIAHASAFVYIAVCLRFLSDAKKMLSPPRQAAAGR